MTMRTSVVSFSHLSTTTVLKTYICFVINLWDMLCYVMSVLATEWWNKLPANVRTAESFDFPLAMTSTIFLSHLSFLQIQYKLTH